MSEPTGRWDECNPMLRPRDGSSLQSETNGHCPCGCYPVLIRMVPQRWRRARDGDSTRVSKANSVHKAARDYAMPSSTAT